MSERGSADRAGMSDRRWSAEDGVHIDVRGMQPPQPMVTILSLLRSIDDDTAVIAHLDRDPQMLYPELAELGWAAQAIEGEPGEVRLRLTRAA